MSQMPETFQIPLEAAEAYEARFVPALFAEWAPYLVTLAGVAPGQAVLDVACGTGIVSRTAAEVVGPGGRVVGVDLNEAMLTVARRVRPDLTWRQGDAARLPFPDQAFDAVLCQMALMFFPDRAAALREMRRVARPGGTVALVVPGSLRDQPAYAPFVEMVARHVGDSARSLLGAYFACGDLAELTALIESAGLKVRETRTRQGRVRLDSADDFVAVEVKSTPLAARMSETQYRGIQEEAQALLRPYTAPGGGLEVPLVGHLLAAVPAAPSSG